MRHIHRNPTLPLVVAVSIALLFINSLVSQPLIQAAGTITGVVFHDRNIDGIYNTGTENGVAGVTVSAYDAAGALQGTAISTSTGTYSLSAGGTGPYRIEFTNLPPGYTNAPQGTASHTSVQFVADGNSSNNNYGVLIPDEFCQNNPNIVTDCFIPGHQNGTRRVIARLPYLSAGDQEATAFSLGEENEVGAVWGLAYQPSSQYVFSSAYMRRHSNFGPGGPGQIYRTNAAGVVTSFVTIPNAGTNPHPLSATPSPNCITGTGTTYSIPFYDCYFYDPASYSWPGRMSLGDIDLYQDPLNPANDLLFVVNMFDRNLYRVSQLGNVTPTVTAFTMPLALPGASQGCNIADVRPFALTFWRDSGYAGFVCSAATSQNRADLRAYIYSFNPTTVTFGSAPLVEFPLNYARGWANSSPMSANWQPWISSEASVTGAAHVSNTGANYEFVYPQPMLSDIVFDRDGNITVGLRDRFGDQGGSLFGRTNTTSWDTVDTIAAGDTLKVCLVASSYQVESNGSCGGTTSAGNGTTPQGLPQGPGGAGNEFYYRDAFLWPNGSVKYHEELSTGGLTYHPTRHEIMTTVFDPLEDPFTGGTRRFNVTNGNQVGQFQLYNGQITTFGKSNGMGDVEILCDQAPIEVGNRVWQDTNNNGRQDPGEPVLSGVVVTLHNSAGTQIGSATTNTNGNYYFSSTTGINQPHAVYGLSIMPGSAYTIRINTTQPAIGTLTPTLVNDIINATDLNDSDGDPTLNPGFVTVPFTAGRGGSNNHTYDFGFAPAALTFSLGNRVWIDTNNDGLINGAEAGVDGVSVSLFLDANADGTPDVPTAIATMVTANGGYYRFDNLPANTYVVRVNATNFATGGPLAGYASSIPTVTTPNNDIDSDDNGIDNANPATNGILSGPVTLGPTANEPTGETDLSPSGQFAPDAQANMTVDFGFFQVLASIGDTVWFDTDMDGMQDAGEPGVPGVTVRLLDSTNTVIGTTVTDANGNYLFDNLVPGNYAIEVVLPPSYVFTTQDSGGDDATDSDVNIGTGRTIQTTLSPGENDMTWDAGIYQLASLGDTVWYDTTRNNVQDIGEAGVPNVTVRLLDSGGATIATTTTDANGNYLFNNLVPGTYSVEFDISTLPSNYRFVSQDIGGNDALDSDANPTTGATIQTTLTAGENDLTWDAGIYQLASIGDTVWFDTDNDGVQDAGEPGAPNVTVNLLDSTGTQIDTTTTDANGNYLFIELEPGDYQIEVILPTGYTFTIQDSPSGTEATDSDVNPTTGRTVVTTLTPGENDLTWDAGLVLLMSLGNRVWIDTNNDGLINGAEAGVDGVSVSLFLDANADGAPDSPTAVATTTTANGGYYRFDNLPANTYVVRVNATNFATGGPLEGYASSIPTVATPNNNIDSDDNGIDNPAPATNGILSGPITLGPAADEPTGETDLSPSGQGAPDNQANMTVDFGFFQLPASLGDTVWYDSTRNNVQDVGEAGVPNVTVRLLDSGGATIATTVTDASGNYLFDNLVPGTYSVEFDISTLPNNYRFVSQDIGGDDALDSDANPTTGATIQTTLTAGENDLTWDAGIYQLASIGDRVWFDADNDGVQDAGEPGVPNVTVNLLDNTGTQLDTTTTDANGNYLFDELEPGDYIIEVVPPTGYGITTQDSGGNDATDSDIDTTTGRTIVTTLTPGENDMTWDAGLILFMSLGNRVWFDINNDGLINGAEAGIDNVSVSLFLDANADSAPDSPTAIATMVTANGGYYRFDNLPANTYVVRVNATNFTAGGPLEGYASSTPTVATPNNNIDSDDNGINDPTPATNGILSGPITLGPAADEPTGETDLSPSGQGAPDNQANMTVDFGFFQPPASLGDTVWYDSTRNNVQDVGEAGVPNVTVRLLDSGGTTIATTTTDANGNYLFDNLAPGTYSVEFDISTLPSNYRFVSQDIGGNDALDSDANPTTGATIQTTLTAGENDLTWDAGIYQLASIGDIVWYDTDMDGVQDAGEPGVPNVTVNLLDGSGTVIATITTDASGNYLFDELEPGDYQIEVISPTGYGFTTQDSGGNDATDSDVDTTTGRTIVTTLTPGENDLTWDAGVVGIMILGNLVWNDINNNGVVDAGENGIANVTVRLLDSTGATILANTTTDANGNYLFSNLQPGDYVVEIVPLAGYVTSTGTNGSATGPYEAAPDPDNDTNDDDNGTLSGATIRSAPVTLTANTEPTNDGDADTNSNLSVDFGLFQPASLGDYVWEDTTLNGVQDAGEAGVPNVTVTLYNAADDSVVATTTTDASGAYLFSNLIPGSYYVIFSDLPAGYTFVPADQGGDDALDSDANIITGRTGDYTLVAGQHEPTVDSGIVQGDTLRLGNLVWADYNDNGEVDAGEPGIPGVVVELMDATGTTVLASTTTDASGNYLFQNLNPGDYIVRIPSSEFGAGAALENWSSSSGGGTYEPAADPDTNTSDNRDNGTLTGGAVQSLPITLSLLGEPDTAVDGDDTNGNLTVDFGFVPQLASLGDTVWYDTTRNNVQDAGEAGVPGVTVRLLDSTGAVLLTTTTDASGNYLFDNLVPGVYSVEFDISTLPADYRFVSQDIGGGDALDSDANPTTGATIQTTLTAGENDLTWDAGVYQLASIGDIVWYDTDHDGVQDSGEPGVPNVTVRLLDDSGTVIATTTTDASGNYLFDELEPGDYAIEVVPPAGYAFTTQDSGSNDALDSDVDSTTGRTIVTTLTPGENDITWDAGLVGIMSLGNLVWNDINNNGVVDAGESGIAGVTVDLLDASGTVLATTTTDANGNYLFSNLQPGDYIVEIVPPAGYRSSTGTNGSATGPYEAAPDPDNDTDNDDNGTLSGATIRSALVTLSPNNEPITDGDTDANSNLTVDFGLFQPASLGDYVWHDQNANGVQDAGEAGVPGVTVTLYTGSGTVVATTTTDASGQYRFDNLVPGDYYVVFSNLPPSLPFVTTPNVGDDATDSDANPATGRTQTVTLSAGQHNPTLDMGILSIDPSAITLVHFSATRVGAGVQVRWQTGMEQNTFGFHLYRSSTPNRAEAVRVTQVLVLSRGQPGGASYAWTDTSAQPGQTYFYWLHEVEVGGATHEYGPAQTQPETSATGFRLFVPFVGR